jgi:hypothetical protein
MNSSWFDVHGDGQKYEIELRHRVCGYERSIFNGTEAEWQRDVVPLVGAIKRSDGIRIPQSVVEAFNTWRMTEYREHRRQIESQPHRYGMIDWDNDPVFVAPKPVCAAYAAITPNPKAGPGYDCPAYVWHGWMFPGDNTLAHLKGSAN